MTKAEVGRCVHRPRKPQDCRRHSSEGTGLGQPRPETAGGAALQRCDLGRQPPTRRRRAPIVLAAQWEAVCLGTRNQHD